VARGEDAVTLLWIMLGVAIVAGLAEAILTMLDKDK